MISDMKRLYRFFLVACLAGVFITSCTRSYNNYHTIQVPVSQSSLNALFDSLRPASQNLAVTAGSLHTVFGINGTKLTFYPNSFKDKNGNIITKGVINLQLTEVYTVNDMITNRAATTSNGQLLTSGGEVCIKATMNGEEVFANKYSIGFKQAGPVQKPMSLFYGNTNTPDSVVTWLAPATPQVGVYVSGTITYADTSILYILTSSGYDTVIKQGPVLNYYQFDSCANFNWINCDYFYSSSAQLTDIMVYVPDSSYNQSNTEVFIIFPGINAAAHTDQYSAPSHFFHLSRGYYVPVGMPIDIVVVSNKNGAWYYYQQTGITTISGLFIFANMSQSSLSDIITRLQSL